jgi:hypothetical protein
LYRYIFAHIISSAKNVFVVEVIVEYFCKIPNFSLDYLFLLDTLTTIDIFFTSK